MPKLTAAQRERGAVSVLNRLLANAKRGKDGCLEWTASKNRGYGQISYKGIPAPAHKVAYELWYGPVPAGLVLDHLCRNKSCINPAHLEPVSLAENVARGPGSKSNHSNLYCSCGRRYTHRRGSGSGRCSFCRRKEAVKR